MIDVIGIDGFVVAILFMALLGTTIGYFAGYRIGTLDERDRNRSKK